MSQRTASPARSENGFDLSTALFHDSDGSDLDFAASALPTAVAGEATEALDRDSDGDDESFIAGQLAASNRKASNLKGRTVKKGGGFQAFGLNANLLKAIARKGYSVPTPIQRKVIPTILQQNLDCVGMSRTGSGKTAAFVIPMIEKLKGHSTKVGARALVLSPSRELALQTLKVVNDLSRGTDLNAVLLVGGDSLEEQFRSMTSNPDIIIATPGRFLHLKVEMGLDLSSVRYVVFDEADRLFEMGFATQLTEILHFLPSARQTMLFSATLPKSLVEFARAGLQDPILVRLDGDSKVSPDLKNAFFTVKSADKEGALLHIIEDIIKIPQLLPEAMKTTSEAAEEDKSRKRKRDNGAEGNPNQTPSHNSTIIFVATKHHVEYIAQLLRLAGYVASHVYGALDQTARRTQIQAFREGKSNILVVTDVAARGIDVPLLANVINYDFPHQPKIFVHRVGRTARAGQTGWSYSIVRDADAPYLLDLQLFLSKKLILGRADPQSLNFAEVVSVGSLQRDQMERCAEWVNKVLDDDIDLSALKSVAAKGEKLYQRSRNAASLESAKRAHDIVNSDKWTTLHPLFNDESDKMELERERMLARVGGFRPHESIFEIGARRTGKKGTDENVDSIKRIRTTLEMKKRKAKLLDQSNGFDEQAKSVIQSNDEENAHDDQDGDLVLGDNHDSDNASLASTTSLEVTFSQPTSQSTSQRKHASRTGDLAHTFRSPSNFMNYTPNTISLAESHAYGVHSGSNDSNFVSAARSATMDLTTDDTARGYGQTSGIMRWDKRSKKYVRRTNDADGSKGKPKLVRGESGTKIAASFRSGRFDAWKKKERMGRLPGVGAIEGKALPGAQASSENGRKYRHTRTEQPKRPDKLRGDYEKRLKKGKETGDRALVEKGKNEVRGNEEIRKRRREKERRREKNARPTMRKGRGKV